MKTLILSALLLAHLTTTAQDTSRVWVTVNDLSVISSSSRSGFQQFTAEHSIFSVQLAFPNAHSRSLQNVYEMACVCDADYLAKDLANTKGFSEPVIVYEPEMLFIPNDYTLTFQPDYALDLIKAPGAWDYTHGDSNLILGVTDVGYDLTHEELIGKVAVAGDNSVQYHGTAVAVITAGNTNNGIGKSSIGYDCRLGLFAANYNELLVARDNGARVVNASWHDGSCSPVRYLQNIMNELYEDGVVVVAAAGNGGATCNGASGTAYPAGYNHVISVTSVGPNDNHERTPGDASTTHQHNATVDLSAPGYDVPLTVGSGWYLTGNGSSFAAPFVTGTIGLMLSVNPCLTVDEIEYILKSTADNIDALNPAYAGLIGAGRLDAEGAVRTALAYKLAAATPCTRTNQPLQARALTIAPEVFPNPSTGIVFVRYPFKKGQTVSITDALGRIVQQTVLTEDAEIIETDTLPSGAYQVIITGQGEPAQQERILVL